MSHQQQQQNVEIISFQGVAVWKTVPIGSSNNTSSSNSELCAICRSDLSDFCVECATSQAHGVVDTTKSTDNKSCNVAVGGCSHYFHRHCLAGWLKSHSVCPLCQSAWEQRGEDLDRSALV
jgi:tRNA A37 N6-isopentenylltransferase MiaA